MGQRCLAPARLLWLALLWGQASVLGYPRAAQAPNPPPPPPAATPGTATEAAPTEAADFRKHYLSHLQLERSGHTYDIYLFAPDEKVEVLSSPFCGGDEGARQFTGHFQLISATGNAVVSTLDLDPDDTFVEKKPHDGVHIFKEPRSGQNLVALYQYGSCTSEMVQFFAADPSGHLFSVPFLDRDGRTWKLMLTGPDGAMTHFSTGALMFSSYSKDIGYDLCEAYVYDGANFLEFAKWMTQDLAAPLRGLDDAGQAARTLYDFLSILSLKRYSAAAYYVVVYVGSPSGEQVAAKTGQREAFLENYCTVMNGQCLMPAKIESKPGGDTPGALLFQVSFLTSDFQPFSIGSRSTFDFHVAKTADGFKVADLPPRIQ